MLVMMLRTDTLMAALLLMFGADNFVGGESLRGQALIKPEQDRDRPSDPDRASAGRAARRTTSSRGAFSRLCRTADSKGCRSAVGTKQAVGKYVGFLARGAAAHDPLRQPAQILHQHHARA